ncbi:MAG: T9SS type A sorting domain-containing protein [Ignavibacteriales bacterium]|nr:T9SS type A sorting domain-containing protein [Ignavibacteriales bacterium]
MELRYEGQILPTIQMFTGCSNNMGYLVSDSKFYVFDAEDSQIRSANYVQVGETPYKQVYKGDDYLCFYLSSANLNVHTLVAYSLVTKTISEYTGDNFSIFKQLEHGFIFGETSGTPYLYGGYSAYTGTFSTKSSEVYITDILHQYDLNRVYPRLCYLFTSRSEVVNDIATYYLWVYNTLVGEFDEFSYQYSYNNTHLVPSISGTGGQGIFHSTYDKDNNDKVNLITYDVYSRLFTQHDFNITYDYRNTFDVGGHLVSIRTENKLVFYDFICGNSEFYYSNWQTGTFPTLQSIELGNNYAAIVYYKGPGINGMTAFSYNGTTDSLKLVSFSPTNTYFDVFGSVDYSLVKFVNYTESAEHLIYSNVKDDWRVKPFPTGFISEEKTGYYLIIDRNLNSTYIFNPINGEEINIPVKNQGTIHLNDSVFVLPANDLKYYGFSSISNSVVTHPNIYYSNTAQSDRIIIRYNPMNSSDPSHLLYDGNLGVFVALSTSNQTHGSRLLTSAGIKTALTVYDKGFLIAYDPTEITDVEEPYEVVIINNFRLYQNYPNPFNPSTKISWQSPVGSHQTLKVFDVLGREIETIVDGYYEAGPHSTLYIANSSLPSGVYFYQLKAGDFIQTKKMIYLK